MELLRRLRTPHQPAATRVRLAPAWLRRLAPARLHENDDSALHYV